MFFTMWICKDICIAGNVWWEVYILNRLFFAGLWNNTCAFLHWQLSITGKLVMDICCLWTLIKKKKHNDYKITSKESGVTTSVPTSPGTLQKRWWQDANTTYINLPLNTLDVSDVWWDETAVRTCTTATKHEIKVLSGVESLMGFFSCAKSESWVGVSAASNLLFNKPKELSLLLPCLLHKFQTHKQLSVCICPLYDVVKPPLGSWWVEPDNKEGTTSEQLHKDKHLGDRGSSQFTIIDFRREDCPTSNHRLYQTLRVAVAHLVSQDWL